VSAYRKHLTSPEWQAIRKEAAERSGGLCELCKAAAREVHHVTYPRGFANDSAELVLHLCSACHRRSHGMRKLVTDLQLSPTTVRTFKDRSWQAQIDPDGILWASFDSWMAALAVPTPVRLKLQSYVISTAQARENETGEDLLRHNENGDMWATWAALEDGLHKWEGSASHRRDPQGRKVPLDDSEQFLLNNYTSLRRWGQRTQQDAIVGRIQKPAAANVVPLSDFQRVAMAVQELAGLLLPKVEVHDRTLGLHDTRLTLIERTIPARSPDEFLDAKSFLIESGLDPSVTVGKTKVNRAAALGNHLHVAAVEIGPKRQTRLDASRKLVEVGTYRRRDLQRALDELKGRP